MLGLSVSVAFIVGCLVGGASSSTAVPSAQAAAGAPGEGPRYEYRCIHTVSKNAAGQRQADELTEKLNALGADGWKFESFMGPGFFYCAAREV